MIPATAPPGGSDDRVPTAPTNLFGAPPVRRGRSTCWPPTCIADPYTGYGRLRERAPLLRGRYLDGTAAWFVTRQDDVRTVLGDPRFVNDPASVPGRRGHGGTT